MKQGSPEGGKDEFREPVVTCKERSDGLWYTVTLDYYDYDKRQRLQTITLKFLRSPVLGQVQYGPPEYKGIEGSLGSFLQTDDTLEMLKKRALAAIEAYGMDADRRTFP